MNSETLPQVLSSGKPSRFVKISCLMGLGSLISSYLNLWPREEWFEREAGPEGDNNMNKSRRHSGALTSSCVHRSPTCCFLYRKKFLDFPLQKEHLNHTEQQVKVLGPHGVKEGILKIKKDNFSSKMCKWRFIKLTFIKKKRKTFF